ncbi:hypothetical protein K488DRAFT_67215 [Vararia minispora EC-137]|uniref:Uncharacterized protein n=1 Tax=Vararia minispora EC-137 TaxID=1314806 RepID=A0ACB8R0K3_9AGAM|nr:hypothetical protein K488DRAFT_67215 [Vararia minispora EC-137]
MSLKTTIVGTVAFFPLTVHAVLNGYAFGSAFRLGSQLSRSTFNITSAATTFVPGAPPASQPSGGALYLWPGLQTTTGEFIYGSLEQVSPASCTSSADEWCLTAQYVGKKGLFSGEYVAVSGNQPVTLDWAVSSGTWTSSVSVAGDVVSTVSVAAGAVSAFGVANVCLGACAPTTVSQTYRNTTIVLATTTPSFGSTAVTYIGTTVSGLQTADGGLTWTIDEIVVPAGAYEN